MCKVCLREVRKKRGEITGMSYDFDTLVKRRMANLKLRMTPKEVLAAGNISLDGAEPDFKSAPVIEEALISFARNGLYGFTLADDDYRSAVVWWLEHSRGTRIEPEWIVTTLGTIYSAATAIRLCTKPGEGIIITPPVYNRYKQAADRLERKTTACPLILESGRYRMNFKAIELAMADKANRLFILCNPHNPIGQIWRAEELEELASLANKYDVTVYSDEIFADNCYNGLSCPCYLDIKGAAGHAIVATSLGKAFGFTGVNHANIIISDDSLRERFTDRRTRDHYGSVGPMVYECVLAAYTPNGLDWVRASNEYVWENITMLKEFFKNHLPEAQVYGGEGAYIVWIDWSAYFETEEALQDFLVKRAHVCFGEGSDYGCPLFTRICVATPRGVLKANLEAISKAFELC